MENSKENEVEFTSINVKETNKAHQSTSESSEGSSSSNSNSALKSLIKETLSNEFAEGCVKFFETPHLSIKTLLGVFLIVCVCLSAYLTIQSFVSYFAYDVTTTSRIIFETPTTFPKVTLCNVNPFITEFAYEYLWNISVKLG